MEHENRCGLPWVLVTLYNGSFGTTIEDIGHFDFDGYTRPTMDKSRRWVFGLQKDFEDVCMVRCKGMKARTYALDKVNAILDERGVS